MPRPKLPGTSDKPLACAGPCGRRRIVFVATGLCTACTALPEPVVEAAPEPVVTAETVEVLPVPEPVVEAAPEPAETAEEPVEPEVIEMLEVRLAEPDLPFELPAPVVVQPDPDSLINRWRAARGLSLV